MSLLFAMRFDFRNPAFAGTTMAERYTAAIEMAQWADRLGCDSISVSEHHGSDDGYLPSPVPVVAAMAAVTERVRFSIAAFVAPLHDPLRLAEDLVVLDNLTKGRVDVMVAGGYVREEFEMFAVPMRERPRRVSELITTLRSAFTGEPFEFRGRVVRVTPAPYQSGGPPLSMGGSTEAAARRAARLGVGFMPAVPEVWRFYEEELARMGRPDPGTYVGGASRVVVLAEDPEVGWQEHAPYFLHENNAYGAWRAQDGVATPYRSVIDSGTLRETGHYRVLAPAEFAAELMAAPGRFTVLQPLCGGVPPALAWKSLRLFERLVLPAVARAGHPGG
jgi:alkanesulfonate monooxygenase SsuD/methylene tetrahydromethanopterin reductase-like flavin-dependent oxidoreductase (luciferase family)